MGHFAYIIIHILYVESLNALHPPISEASSEEERKLLSSSSDDASRPASRSARTAAFEAPPAVGATLSDLFHLVDDVCTHVDHKRRTLEWVMDEATAHFRQAARTICDPNRYGSAAAVQAARDEPHRPARIQPLPRPGRARERDRRKRLLRQACEQMNTRQAQSRKRRRT